MDDKAAYPGNLLEKIIIPSENYPSTKKKRETEYIEEVDNGLKCEKVYSRRKPFSKKSRKTVTPYAGTTEGIESLSVHWKYMRIPAYLEKEDI